MSNFVSDPTNIKIMTESDLSDIIGKFDDNIILDIIEENISYRYNAITEMSNLVAACESVFKDQINNLEECAPYLEQIKILRDNTYKTIIGILCNKFNFSCDEDEVDLYTAGYTLYNLLISNFRNIISDFFTNYILKEYHSLYTAFGIARFKKQKDSTTIYNKDNYIDPELGLIISNINFVLDNIRSIDFTFESILNYIFTNNKPLADYIKQNFVCNCDFFNDIIIPILNTEYRSILITDIRLKIDSVGINYIDKNELINQRLSK